jgi:hypothetical protein
MAGELGQARDAEVMDERFAELLTQVPMTSSWDSSTLRSPAPLSAEEPTPALSA